MEILIDDNYRDAIFKSKNILGVRFIAGQPVEAIAKDFRFAGEYQVLLTRSEILGDYEERIKAGTNGK